MTADRSRARACGGPADISYKSYTNCMSAKNSRSTLKRSSRAASATEVAGKPSQRSEPRSSPSVRERSRVDAVERIVAVDQEIVANLPATVVEDLAAELDAFESGIMASSNSELTGEQLPDARTLHAIRLANLRRGFAARRALLEDTVQVSELAQILGVARQTPHDREKAGTLLAVKDQGHWRFPVWQLDPDGPDGVIAGLPAVLQALRQSPLSQFGRLRWFITAKSLLNNRSPIEALRAGDIEETLAEARAVGAT